MFLVVIVVIGLLFSIFAYRSVFDGTLSSIPANWGAAGGFFGGIFTPIIAFATLIAIVITIQLQKQLLVTQNNEFKKLYNLQVETLSTQKSELDLAKQQVLDQSINEQKKIYLNLIEQQTDIRRRNMESASEGVVSMLNKKAEGFLIDELIMGNNINQKNLFEKQIQVLTGVSIGFTLQKFNSIAEMDTSITKLFKVIDDQKVLESLYASNGDNFTFTSE